MILKDWSEAQDVYTGALARSRRSMNAIFALHNMWSYKCLWAAVFCLIGSIVVILGLAVRGVMQYSNPVWVYLLLPVPVGFLLWFGGAIEKALANEFAAAYAKHGILHYPFWSRYTYFIYTLFLQELEDRRYSYKQIVQLSSFAEIATPPESPRPRLTQNPLFTFLMGMLVVLLADTIKTSPLWESWITKVLTLSIGLILLGVFIMSYGQWYSFVNRPLARHQRIQRYLKWAEIDLKEEQPF